MEDAGTCLVLVEAIFVQLALIIRKSAIKMLINAMII
jgi:hypothetical protein